MELNKKEIEAKGIKICSAVAGILYGRKRA